MRSFILCKIFRIKETFLDHLIFTERFSVNLFELVIFNISINLFELVVFDIYLCYFRGDIDGWELRKGLNELYGYDLVPEPTIVSAALKACRRYGNLLHTLMFRSYLHLKVLEDLSREISVYRGFY